MQPGFFAPQTTVTPLRMESRIDATEIQNRIHRVIAEATASRTQQELADLAEIQPGMLSNLLNGKATITREHLIQIEQATGVRLDWLEYGLEPMYWANKKAPQRDDSLYHEGKMLKAYLTEQGIGSTDMGKLLDKSKNTVESYFKSKKINPKTKKSILSVLNVQADEVFSQPINKDRDSKSNASNPRLVRHVGNFSAEPIATLPFVPERARAGMPLPSYWEQPFQTTRILRAVLADFEPDPVNPRRSWWVIEVGGDSMEPQLRTRARVLGYYIGRLNQNGIFEINRDQLRTLKPGIWAIQYDEEFVIKRIRVNTIEQDGLIMAHSDNPPPDPFPIRADSIRHVWYIETIVSSLVR